MIAPVVPIADVARRAGVSIATVSRVLSPGPDPHPVRPATAERVRVAARELQFVPSPLARGLAAGRSGLIGLIVPDLTDPHYPHIARGVEDAAREADLAVLICNTLGDSARLAEYVRLLRARRVDAIVLSGGTSASPRELGALEWSGVPVVLIGRPPSTIQLAYVSIDNELAARLATWHLVEGGRRHIVHLGGPPGQTTMADRAAGYAQAMQVAALAPVVLSSCGAPADGYRLLAEHLAGRPESRPDAVFAATDRLAVAALAAAADHGLRVPHDLAVIGFDDIPLAEHLRPSLSSMAQPAHALGSVAIRLARQLLAGQRVEPVTLQARLVARASSQPAGRPPG
jgi:LacI family transcriptional regulator